MSSLIYADIFTMQYNPSLYTPHPDEQGIFIGNGKVGLLSSFKNEINVNKSMITTELSYSKGAYKSNVIDGFYLNKFSFFNNTLYNVSYTLTNQTIDMGIAIFTSNYNIVEGITNNHAIISCDIYTPQNLPFCIMETITINPQNCTSIPFYHEIYCLDNLVNPEYNNNIIYNEQINSNFGISIIAGQATIGHNKKVAFATCYLFELPNTSVANLGFNVYRNDTRHCYNKYLFSNLTINTPFKVHIISATMSSFDFDDPLEEVKRIIISIGNTSQIASIVASNIRSRHVLAWSDMWRTKVQIIPKPTASPTEFGVIERYNLLINVALYNIYSSTRDNVSMDINALNLSIIDEDGFSLYDGDIWLMSILLLLRPKVARPLLEYRNKTIHIAQQISAGYGLQGVKYPYIDDIIGYKNSLYWDPISPMHVFNNGMIAINVWNYYRVSKDRDWLINKGFAVLKGIADFFVSLITYDPITDTYHINNVVGLNGVESLDNNSFTVNTAKLALRYAIEASYELQYYVKENWLIYLNGLSIQYYPNALKDVIKFDAASTNTDTYNIMETFFILLPSMSTIYYCTDCCSTGRSSTNAIVSNLTYYPTSKINAPFTSHPYNTALYAILQGIQAQADPTYVALFQTNLDKFITDNISNSVWNNMIGWASDNTRNNLITNSAFLSIFLLGMTQLNIGGGVAETRFYYEEMRLRCLITANMPFTWNNMSITSVGIDNTKTFYVLNSSTS